MAQDLKLRFTDHMKEGGTKMFSKDGVDVWGHMFEKDNYSVSLYMPRKEVEELAKYLELAVIDSDSCQYLQIPLNRITIFVEHEVEEEGDGCGSS